MEVIYKNNRAYVDGYKFTKDKNTGYYLSTTRIGSRRKRLHVYMYESRVGKIPNGYHVHHIDENKENNEVDNLKMLEGKEHTRLHTEKWTDEEREWFRNNLEEKARPKANEWHGSEEGRKWHSDMAKEVWETKKRDHEHICIVCGEKYASYRKKNSGVCSNKCHAQRRRNLGIDNETRNCSICNGEFEANKYSTKKTCSSKCRRISTKMNKRARA